MKNLKKICSAFLFVTLTAFTFSSCSKDYLGGNNGGGGENKPKSITAIASENKDLSTLVAALKIAKLDMVLDKPGSYTVFAPNNAAFDKFLADNKIAKLEDVPVDLLTNVLLNHVVGKAIFAKSLPKDGYLSTLSPVEGGSFLSLYVNVAEDMVTLNGKTKVTTADIKASNGVIHLVDSVIGLPTVVDQALANKSFTSLVGALTKTGQPDFVSILSGAGPFTVFAPTNDGFAALDKELEANGGIAGVSDANLTSVLQYHVANGNLLAKDLVKVKELETLNTQKFAISVSKKEITDAADRKTKIAAVDVQCSNGVIHVLGGVLLPKL
jgi:uncharacterized surface protein with fasciclin (FAS1) repeats